MFRAIGRILFASIFISAGGSRACRRRLLGSCRHRYTPPGHLRARCRLLHPHSCLLFRLQT